jgi:hypothetical protein
MVSSRFPRFVPTSRWQSPSLPTHHSFGEKSTKRASPQFILMVIILCTALLMAYESFYDYISSPTRQLVNGRVRVEYEHWRRTKYAENDTIVYSHRDVKEKEEVVDESMNPSSSSINEHETNETPIVSPSSVISMSSPSPVAADVAVASPSSQKQVIKEPLIESTSKTLVIGIPTVKRKGDPDYLVRALTYLLEQMDENGRVFTPTSSLNVRIVVVNNQHEDTSDHVAFETAKSTHCDEKTSCVEKKQNGNSVFSNTKSPITFVINRKPRIPIFQQELTSGNVNLANDPNVPNPRVQQQTSDVIELLTTVDCLYGLQVSPGCSRGSNGTSTPAPADYYMFMEDDFRICPKGLESIVFAMLKADEAAPDWNAIRISLGLNGALIRISDVNVLANYYSSHIARRPPDHLLVEWFAGETLESYNMKRNRPHAAFKHNLLEHFGFSSSLRETNSPMYAFCFDLLVPDVVFEVESYKPGMCLHEFIWPCLPPTQQSKVVSHIDYSPLIQDARVNTVQKFP